MTGRRVTAMLAGLTVLVLALSLPGAWRDVFDCGGIYLFSRAFLDDTPGGLTGPGRFRLLLQPLFAPFSASGVAWPMPARGGSRSSTCSFVGIFG
jgi:hypothetical protein